MNTIQDGPPNGGVGNKPFQQQSVDVGCENKFSMYMLPLGAILHNNYANDTFIRDYGPLDSVYQCWIQLHIAFN